MDVDEVNVTLDAMEPTALIAEPSPVAVRNLGPSGMGEAVELTGPLPALLAFVAQHWGVEEARDVADRINATDEQLRAAFDPINAATVRAYMESVAFNLHNANKPDIERDDNPAPEGTRNYDGRALAYHVEHLGRELRVTVEDVTMDGDVAP
jgi:hypothetical protein